MKTYKARIIAEVITNEQLLKMMETARTGVKDWNQVSNINKGITKGYAWNILASSFDVNRSISNIIKINMIREFGEFLPNELIPKNKKNVNIKPYHQEPVF